MTPARFAPLALAYPPHIKWLDSRSDEPSTPFGDGSLFSKAVRSRPLRVTLDSTCLTEPNDRAAAQAFVDFRKSPLLELYITDPGLPGGVTVPSFTDQHEAHIHLEVELRGEDWTSGVTLPLVGEMRETLQRYGMPNAKSQLALAWFHKGRDGDILISCDPVMQEMAKKIGYLGLSVVTPPVALRLFGLLLRYHEEYTIRAAPNDIINRWPFYWSLARQKLPAFWRYFSACGYCPDKTIRRVGGSILNRAARALEARDYVGYEHYGPVSHDAADRSSYHFDYLLLLLAGALDAMALIAKSCYSVQVADYEAGFRRARFRAELARANGGDILDWLALPENADVLVVLHELRNKIHGAELQAVQSSEGVLFEIPVDLVPLIPKIRRLCPEYSCVSRDDKHLRHYPLALALVERVLQIMDGIAARTDVLRLLPSGKVLPAACVSIPKGELFSGPRADRIAAMG